MDDRQRRSAMGRTRLQNGRKMAEVSAGTNTTAFSVAAQSLQRSRSLQGNPLDFLRPQPKPCPLGFICSPITDDVYPCKIIQDKAYTIFDFGGIHAGMYCPENKTTFVNCPVGHYCPDPSTKLPCPAGYFCPHKTGVPEQLCKDCPEASTSVARPKWGDDLMISLAAFVVALYFIFLWSHWYGKRKARLKAMEERFLSADREKALKLRERSRLERIRPRLEKIAERIEAEIQLQRKESKRFNDYELEELDDVEDDAGRSNGNEKDDENRDERINVDNGWSGTGNSVRKSHVHFNVDSGEEDKAENEEEDKPSPHGIYLRRKFMGFDLDGNIWFDADILFDTLDADGSEDLSYEELNTFMQLEGVELVHFIRTMNELGGIYVDDEDESDLNALMVPRHIFVENFLEALEVASNFNCTRHDAEILFDEIVAAKEKAEGENKSRRPSWRASSSRASRRASRRASKAVKLQVSDLFNSRCAGFMSEAQINGLTKRIRDEKKKKGVAWDRGITRDEFAKFYPKMLGDVTGRHANLKDLRAQSNMGEGFDLAFTNLCLTVKVGSKSINVVNKLTGRLQAKTMTAVMGGSGSGKTSLLNALSGRSSYGEVSGTIRINGTKSPIENHKNEVGYVPQDDIVYHELTVRENLVYSGRFQLRAGSSKSEIEDLADEVLANLGLTKVKDSIVGDVGKRGISGGERKRVNIGIELMRRPQILFLDEPTSGLDSSSAMLLTKCLRSLVSLRGITVCGVIHQPRKYIFDLFHSLILLADGGNMVYAGPTSQAEAYFTKMSYVLPSGEGVADWLIDVSSGRLRPVRRGGVQSALAQSYYQKGPTTGFGKRQKAAHGHTIEKSMERAKMARQNLARAWKEHFANLSQFDKEQFLPPKRFGLPQSRKRPGFFRQVGIQIRRNFLIIRRNWILKFIDTVLIVGAVALISGLEGVFDITKDIDPLIPYEALVSDDRDDLIPFFELLFAFAMAASASIQEYALKVGVITAVLVGLAASRVITGYKLQFFRESASGYDPFAYFVSINITSTFEHGLQILLCCVVGYWLRGSAAPIYAFFVNFLLMGWLAVSWSFLLSIITPMSSTTVVIGFFMAFFGLLFSGGLAPATYVEIYDPDRKALAAFCGLVSPTRYFIEMAAVNEHRTLPPQSGFTYIPSEAFGLPADSTSFDFLSLAQNDQYGVAQRSNSGWYWSVLPAIIVGLTVRLICGIILAFQARQVVIPLRKACAKQMNKPFWRQFDVFENIFFWMFAAFVAAGYLVGVSIWLIIRKLPVDQRI